MLYWADILHSTPLNVDDKENQNRLYVPEIYPPKPVLPISKSMDFRNKAAEYLSKYYEKIWVEKLLPLNNPKITDLFIHLHLKDLESYYSPLLLDHSGSKRLAREVISERIIQTLKKYQGDDILIIAHSMGSIILHDALMEYGDNEHIHTLVTIGSPLAQNYVIAKMQAESIQLAADKLVVPKNIRERWLNLADLEDQVAINYQLHSYYKKSIRGLAVEDMIVNNTYESNGIQNPHCSFGYLRTPEMANIIQTFLTHKKRGFVTNLWNTFRNKWKWK